MAEIAVCPHCRESVTVPPAASAEDRFLCPLCGQAFAAEEARTPAAPSAVVAPATSPAKKLHVEFVSDVAEQAQALPSVALRRPTHRSSPLGNLLGVIGGGVIGLTIGYCVLLRIKGAEADFLEIAPYFPQWATGMSAEETPIDAGPPDQVREIQQEPTPADPPLEESPPLRSPPPAEVAPQDSSSAAPLEPAPPALPPEYVGPRHFTPRSSEELGQALVKVNDALGCENCRSTGFIMEEVVTGSRVVDGRKIETKQNKRVACPVCGGKPSGKSLTEIYAALGELAAMATYLRADENDTMLPERRAAAERLLRTAVKDPERAQNLGRLASATWDEADAAGKGTILLGTVKSVREVGRLFHTRLVLLGVPKEVLVVAPRRPSFQTGDRVAILSNIVDRPAEELIGYEGDAPRVAWGGLTEKLP